MLGFRSFHPYRLKFCYDPNKRHKHNFRTDREAAGFMVHGMEIGRFLAAATLVIGIMHLFLLLNKVATFRFMLSDEVCIMFVKDWNGSVGC